MIWYVAAALVVVVAAAIGLWIGRVVERMIEAGLIANGAAEYADEDAQLADQTIRVATEVMWVADLAVCEGGHVTSWTNQREVPAVRCWRGHLMPEDSGGCPKCGALSPLLGGKPYVVENV